MKNHFDKPAESEENGSLREKIIGLGENSIRKNYYPQLMSEISKLRITTAELDRAKRAEEETANIYRAIHRHASDGILLVEPRRMDVKLCNPAMLKILGLDSKKSIENTAKQETAPELAHSIEKLISSLSGKSFENLEIMIERDNLDPVFTEASGSLIEIDGREYILGIFRDITESRIAEAEKEEFRSRMNHAQKMEAIGALAGGIAHDFNNILAAIISLTELSLKSNDLDPEIGESLKQIMGASFRARDIVTQLLSISHSSADNLEPVDIIPHFLDTVKLVRSAIPASVDIITDINADSGTVLADTTQISQVMLNLCTNSYHSMPEGKGHIYISCANIYADLHFLKTHPGLSEGWHFVIDVTDDGSGISRDVQERMFEPFFTTKPRGKGTGLGLSIIHGIVKKHGGSINVYSEPGRGTTFKIYLPLASDREAAKPVVESLPGMTAKRIMLVDDEEMIARTSAQLLKILGYDVEFFTSSTEALNSFTSDISAFDIVITDMTMPEMDGLDLAAKIMSLRPDIPVILCTGFNENLTRETIKDSGIRELVMKPFTTSELVAVLNRVS